MNRPELGCKDTFCQSHGYRRAHVHRLRSGVDRLGRHGKPYLPGDCRQELCYVFHLPAEKWRIETANTFRGHKQILLPCLIGIKTGTIPNGPLLRGRRQGRHGGSLVPRSKEGAMWTDTARLFDYGFTAITHVLLPDVDRAPIYAAGTPPQGRAQAWSACSGAGTA